jgi:hypothetical protein
MTERRGRRHKQLPDDFREKRRYWKFREKALAGCVWWTRFGRSYGPVADWLRDDDADDDDDTNMSPIHGRSLDTVAMERNGKRLPTSDSAARCQYAVTPYSAARCQYAVTPYSYCTQLCIIWQISESLNVISFSLSISNFTHLYWINNGHLNYYKYVNLNIINVQILLNLKLEITWLLWRQR